MCSVMVADRVLVGPVGEVIENGAVVISDRTIAWVGEFSELPDQYKEEEEERRTFEGATILPGLIDSHVHLGFDGGPNPVARMKGESDAEQLILMLRSARELLGVGVTTARDLGARNFLDVVVRDAIAHDMARGLRMIVANRPITVTGGHCWFMGGEADGPDEVRRMVRLHHRQGADCIKLMATGGFMTTGSAPWFAQFTTEELQAAVDEAHRLGMRVAAHGHGGEGIRRAAAAGVDTIEHCSFADEPTPDTQDIRKVSRTYSEEVGEEMARKGIAVCPTINTNAHDLREQGVDIGGHLHELRAAGVQLIAGTDSGIDNCPHYEYVGGLEFFAELGFDAGEIIEMATSRAAAALGVDKVTGRLAPGLEADLVIVGGDPRKDISALRDLRLVVARGRDYLPDSGAYDLSPANGRPSRF